MQRIPQPVPTAKLNNLPLEGNKYGGPMETKEETELRGDVSIVSMPPFTANPPPESMLDPFSQGDWCQSILAHADALSTDSIVVK